MENKLKTSLKNGFTFYCMLYTITTIFSSTLQLFQGRTVDTNSHLLHRAVICFIAVFSIEEFGYIRIKSRLLKWLIGYLIAMAMVYIYVWITTFFEPLGNNALRDIFFNFTSVAIIICIITETIERRKEKQGR